MRHVLMLSLAALTVPFATIAHAAWPQDPAVNRLVRLFPVEGASFRWDAIPVVAGDIRVASNHHAGNGAPYWVGHYVTSDGDLPNAPEFVPWRGCCYGRNTAFVADGSGDVVSFWTSDNWPDVSLMARRVNANGVSTFPGGDLMIEPAVKGHIIAAASDGAGGAVVFWIHESPSRFGIRAQRLDPTGASLWPNGGLVVSQVYMGSSEYASATYDGHGAITLVWSGWATYSTVPGIWAQRVTIAGIPQWGEEGALIYEGNGERTLGDQTGQFGTKRGLVVPDGQGGAIVPWVDRRSGASDLYAQRVDSVGTMLWASDGAPVCTASGDQRMPSVVSDGAGGAYFAFDDLSRARLQHLDGAGVQLLPAAGLLLSPDISTPFVSMRTEPDLAPDGLGGLFAAWTDTRNGWTDIYAQRLRPDGSPRWHPDGIAVSTAPLEQTAPRVVPTTGSGAIVTWFDRRFHPDSFRVALFSQRIPFDDTLEVPAPANRTLKLSFPAGNRLAGAGLVVEILAEPSSEVRLELVDVAGRRRARRTLDPGGASRTVVTLEEAAPLGKGVYWLRATQGTDRSAVARFVVVR